MQPGECRAAIARMLEKRPSFLLSEFCKDYFPQLTPRELLDRIQPYCQDIQIIESPLGDDFEIRSSFPFLSLNEEEYAQERSFLEKARVPGRLETIIEDYISLKVGKSWKDPVILDRIRKAIIQQKDCYWAYGKNREIRYEKGYQVWGYLAYQLPVYLIQFEHILFRLAREGLLKRDLRLLDAGTGPGVVPLATMDFFRRLNRFSLDITAIEQSDEHIEAYNYLVPEFRGNSPEICIHPPIKSDLKTIRRDQLPDCADLIVFQNVLNEITDRPEEKADIVRKFLPLLADDGSILIMEPADRMNATALRVVVMDLVSGGVGLYGPCTLLRGGPCQPQNCWTFEERPPIRPTTLMKTLAAAGPEAYRYVNTDIKYASAILRKDTRTMKNFRITPKGRYVRFSSLKRHVNRYVNAVACVMSGDLGDSRTHVYKLCDGTSVNAVYAILPSYHATGSNRALLSIGYGDIIALDQVLVRFNPRHEAYNLLINKKSGIIPLN
jgi:hypothetical protein